MAMLIMSTAYALNIQNGNGPNIGCGCGGSGAVIQMTVSPGNKSGMMECLFIYTPLLIEFYRLCY